MSVSMLTTPLTDEQFAALSGLVSRTAGIHLNDGKKELVASRLATRLRRLNCPTFDEYIDHLAHDTSAHEMTAMLDAISTNLTSFFRESGHFDFLTRTHLPKIVAACGANRRLRAWSAGCSSGEEPYSLAICLHENLPDIHQWDVQILATDLSTRTLAEAARGVYDAEAVEQIARHVRNRYFAAMADDGPGPMYQVDQSLRRLVTFERLNLMGPWPMRDPFDVIFCRNVMIYFDKPTQSALVDRYFDLLAPGGLLFVGQSESLTGLKHRFRCVQPTIYQRP